MMKLLPKIFVAETAIAVGLLVSSPTHAATYSYADVTGWDTLSLNTPTAYSWKGVNDLTVTQIIPPGDGITLGTATLSFPASNPSNPPWIAGTRDLFQVAYDSNNGINDFVAYRWEFSQLFSPQDYLVFADFDFGEAVFIEAYDTFDQLIPFSDFTFAQENGLDTNGSIYSNIVFF